MEFCGCDGGQWPLQRRRMSARSAVNLGAGGKGRLVEGRGGVGGRGGRGSAAVNPATIGTARADAAWRGTAASDS